MQKGYGCVLYCTILDKFITFVCFRSDYMQMQRVNLFFIDSNRQSSLKRRSSRDSDGSHRKVMNIETEQGDVFTIERADTDDDCDGKHFFLILKGF